MLEDCLLIEVFAGSARVTASLKQLGLKSSFGVDKLRSKNAMAGVIIADLATPQGEALLMSWLQMPQVVGIFLAPPCGSASRARQIPLKRKFGCRQRGPRPLRTDAFPNGIPNLTPTELSRISLANKLYHLSAKLVKWACDVGCIFVVENPQFSLFWATTFWTAVAHLALYSVFHSCQYGGMRKKKTMLAFNAAEFLAVSAMCPGQSSKHKHAQWGLNSTNGFATADETAYPMGLARLIAVVFTPTLLRLHILPLPDTLEQVQSCSLQALQKMRATTGQQSRASKMPPLVRTYKQRVKLKGPRSCLPNFSILQRAKEDVLLVGAPKQWLPKGSRLLSIEHVPSPSTGGEDSERTAIEAAVSSNATCSKFSSNVNAIDDNAVGDIERDQQFAGDFLQTLNLRGTEVSGTDEVQVQIWGTPWSPDEFVGMAVKAGHPAMLQSFLPTQLSACIEKGMRMSCHERIAHRANMFKFWLKRSLQLKAEETALAAKLEPGVAEVLKGKRILLWKEMLQSINYVDMGVVDEFCEGSRLTGQMERTGLWPSKVTPATVTEQELHVQAKMQRAALTYGQVVFFDDEIAGAVWEQTLAEVAKGELDGPLDLSQVPDHYPLSRRFGVKQNDKIRCVDDFSWSGINSAAQPLESPKPHTLDVIGGMMLAVMNQSPPGLQWLARSFDLKSAYRQCAVHPDARRFSYIVVGDPATSTLKAFRLRALPFGSVKSVHSFLRIAHSLW